MLSLDFLTADDGFKNCGSLLQVTVMRKIPSVSPINSGIYVFQSEVEAFVEVVQCFLLSCFVFVHFDAGVVKSGCLEGNG